MLNIAIYARKSVFTCKGESIENQIELCKNYCSFHFNNHKELNYLIYEDDGFSGSNINRPQFQHMINDIKSKKIDNLICYRLDRISRNVADFSSTLELLQKYNVNFISIKERFDTSTPLGRAMIYIASVFAQLERETIAERVRDNMIELAKSGRWLGGNIPYGFNTDKINYLNTDFKEKTLSILTPNEEELKIVNFIYDYYLKTHSIREVTKLLNTNYIVGKKGGNFDLTQVRRILRNPLYVKSDLTSHNYLFDKGINVFGEPNGNGYISYNKSKHTWLSSNVQEWIVAVSKHKGIITSDKWLKVQEQLDYNKIKKPRLGTGKNHSLLSGLIKCNKCGANMIVKFSGKNKNNIPYEYYVCSEKQNKFSIKCDTKNISVDKFDKTIIENIKIYNKQILMKTLKEAINDTNCNFENEEISSLENKIKENKILLNNLIKQLGKSPSSTISEAIMTEVNTIDKKIISLNNHLNDLKSQNLRSKTNSINLEDFIQMLESFSNTIDYIKDINQKRFLIQSIVKFVLWDSSTNNAEIILKN